MAIDLMAVNAEPQHFQVGDRVVKNLHAWQENELDSWGAVRVWVKWLSRLLPSMI